MTVTILSLVCIVLAALCLCLWIYASHAADALAEALWESGEHWSRACTYHRRWVTLLKKYEPDTYAALRGKNTNVS